MENQPHIRFAETPPGSPKSCLKGSRKLTFEDKTDEPSGDVSVSPRSPRKSTKVCIRSPGDNSSPSKPVVIPPIVKPPDIQFSQHYDQSTPPPNCTSNGSYDFVETCDNSGEVGDSRNDPYLMEVASKFVNEIIETATLEAANRQKPDPDAKPNLASIAREIFTTGRQGGAWVRKWITNLCVKAQNSIRT